MNKLISQSFFDRPAYQVCPELLGKFLVCPKGAWMITEIEAYGGAEDLASHARHGQTKRNAPMFGEAGYRYIYLIYGMYQMLNITTGPGSEPGAILIRGIKGFPGPGKLTKHLEISQQTNAQPATKKTGLWIEDRGVIITNDQIVTTPRVGVDYAGERAQKPRNFALKI